MRADIMGDFFKRNDIDEEIEKESIGYWIQDLQKSSKLLMIIKTAAFNRLYGISFLGAIDYSDQNELTKKERNRAIHSLYVAGIANYVATKRNYNSDLKEHLVAAALLHDIGHMPLSHSAEPFIKEKFGYGHHELGNNLISGTCWVDSGLSKALNKNFDVSFIKGLLNFELKNDGHDIFSNKINADTIDGIVRCIEYKGKNKANHLNRISIAKAAFLDNIDMTENKRLQILDNFWNTKHFVYQNFINTKHSVISDKISQIFFRENKKIEYKNLLSDERRWREQYKLLFKWLSNLKSNSIPHCLKNYEMVYTTRNYKVLKTEKDIKKRYTNNKNKAKISEDSLLKYREE